MLRTAVQLRAAPPVITILTSHRAPGVWGFASYISSPQKSVPDGPHEWRKTGPGMRCRKCELGVVVGTDDPGRAVVRLAGRLCSDALAIEVLSS